MVYVLILAKFIFYCVLAAHCLFYRRIAFFRGGAYDAWLKVNHTHIWNLHGVIVFLCLLGARVVAQQNLFQYLAGSIMIWATWDGGAVHARDIVTCTLINLHHLGAVIALVYQPEEEHIRAVRNTAFFSWLWLIHSFAWIQSVVLPLLGLPKLEEGGKYQSMEVARHAYGAVSVYLFYDYVASDGQPGFGLNYQTAAVCAILLGRLFTNDNFVKVGFIRRVEFPGFLILGLGQLVSTGEYKIAAGIAVVVTRVVLITLGVGDV